MNLPSDKTILSGIQPSGTLHLGNYLGALKQWVALQEHNTAFYCIVDLHAITVDYDPAELQGRILDTAAVYLAVGVDPNQSTLFVQSHVPEHAELMWLLGTTTPLGELERMTQFKEKSERQKTTSLGLFAYPVLQAADILLYQPHLVPVGEDQIQHIELTRDIAKRFNNKFGDAFTVPEAHVTKDAARIMSLTEPQNKMSKSDTPKSYIGITEDADTVTSKIMSATTETEPAFSFAESGPAVKNLLSIYQTLSDETPDAIEQRFSGAGYKEFKEALAELVVSSLTPIRERFTELRAEETHLKEILAAGQAKAQEQAAQTLATVKAKMGLR